MSREGFIITVSFTTMVLAAVILLGNRGILPDYSLYLWPMMVVSLIVLFLTHPISKLYRAVKFFHK